ncbi:hypothetical protein DITRI_Ditri03aG0207900 [Diplodiscus trichospermus]
MEYQRASAAMAFSKKLSNGHSFNGKNIYDGVFGGQSKVGSRVEDYAEIFGDGSGSSIPVLDVPELNEKKFVSSSKVDYSNIFGAFGDFGSAVSHEEFIAKKTRDKKTPAKTRSYSEGSFSYPSSIPVGNQVFSNDQTSHESGNGVKQFKMSFNKSSPGSKNGTNGTAHVAQLRAVPDYTCLIDERTTQSRDSPGPSVIYEPYQTNNFGEGVMEGLHCKKPVSNIQPSGIGRQNSKGVDELHNESRSNGYDFNDVLFGSNDVVRRTPPSKVTRASSMLNNVGGHKCDSLKYGVSGSHSLHGDTGIFSPPYLDDEVDANSVAATSAAAVKKAIEEAQAKLKIAREMMERRKGGRIGCVKPSFSGSSETKEREKGKGMAKENNFRQDKAQETSANIYVSVQPSAETRKQNVMKVGQEAAESEVREKSCIAREAAGVICANNFISSQADCRQEEVEKREAAKEGEREKDLSQALNKYEGEQMKIIEKPEKYGEKSEVGENATKQDYETKIDVSKELCNKEECLTKLKPDEEFHDQKEDETKLRFSEQWDAGKKNNFRLDKAQGTYENIDVSVQRSAEARKQNVMKAGQGTAESEEREKSFIAREVAGGTWANSFILSQADCRQEEEVKKEAAKEGEREKDLLEALNKYEGKRMKIIEKPEKYVEKSEVGEDATKREYETKIDVSKELCNKEECLTELKPDEEFHDQKEDETKLRFSKQWEETEGKVCIEQQACEKKLNDPEKLTEDERKVDMQELKDVDNLERLTVAQEWVDIEEKHKHMLKQEENGSALRDVFEKEENEMLLQDGFIQKEFEKMCEEAFHISEQEGEYKETCGQEENNEEEAEDAFNREDNEQISDKMEKPQIIEKMCEEAFDISEQEGGHKETCGQEENNEEESEDVNNREDNKQISDKMEKPQIFDLRHNGFDYKDARERRLGEKGGSLGNKESMEAEENGDLFEDAYKMEAEEEGQKETSERMGTEEMLKQTDQKEDEMAETREDAIKCCWKDLEAVNYECDDIEINKLDETLKPSIKEDRSEITPELLVNDENGGGIAEGSKAYSECKETRRDPEEVEGANEENLAFDKPDLDGSNLELNEIEQQKENRKGALDFDRCGIDIDTADTNFEQNQYEQHSKESEVICTLEKHDEKLACESEEHVGESEFGLKQEENNSNSELYDEGRLVDSQLHCKFGEKHESSQIAHEIETSQSTESNEESHHETLTKGESETKKSSQEEVKLLKEQQRRLYEAKEREREKEKEKERIAVERAIREARERAFAEARERAAGGRTNAEARRKVKAEAQQESAKPSAEVNDKIFMEAKLKAERAAVERATAEARQRALEKALSEKASFGARKQAEKSADAKQSFQSYDLRYKDSCPATSRYPNSTNQSASNSSERLDGATVESAQISKAMLERHQRTAERAAKALAEKNKRDLLAQKEQAERNRLAETLDAEVKRWSSGKQGNLRALLSTLQYVLGPDSGWQPIPLTDMVATAAVKKAYRKATLCVHPDKLQQRGASTQQKYTCEKVFDLLKEAWNKFSEER